MSVENTGMHLISVLTTVNAPYSKKLDAPTLAYCLKDIAAAKQAPGQMSAFFGEVQPELQKAFAALYGIDVDQLVCAAKTFSEYSGQTYPLAASGDSDVHAFAA